MSEFLLNAKIVENITSELKIITNSNTQIFSYI